MRRWEPWSLWPQSFLSPATRDPGASGPRRSRPRSFLVRKCGLILLLGRCCASTWAPCSHSGRHFRHFVACKSTPVRHSRGFVAPKSSELYYIFIEGDASRPPKIAPSQIVRCGPYTGVILVGKPPPTPGDPQRGSADRITVLSLISPIPGREFCLTNGQVAVAGHGVAVDAALAARPSRAGRERRNWVAPPFCAGRVELDLKASP